MKKLLPVLLAVIGLGGGLGAGMFLRPSPAAEEHANGHGPEISDEDRAIDESPNGDDESYTFETNTFVRLDHQFVVPVLSEGRVSAMVAMSLTLDVEPEVSDAALLQQPLLRDRFLRVLMDHANTGGFDGTFTSNGALGQLKSSLVDAGNTAIGGGVKDVLILDVARQDV